MEIDRKADVKGRLAKAEIAKWEPPSSAGYVGSRACAECHAEIAESFSAHPMARSVSRIEPDAEEAALPAEKRRVAGNQRVLSVEMQGGQMRHHEQMFDAAGKEIYDQAVTIEYSVGSGRRAKAYLHRRGSLLFMSPLNWYTQTGQWDLAPGYAKDDPRRFERRVTDECLSCHVGRIAPVGRSLNRYEDPPFHELSIGCENCHGPGEKHVALRRADPAAAAAAETIVNPAHLDPARRESVCNQCHLQGAVRVPRYGRSDLDFRPGRNLEEIWTAFDQGSGISGDRTRSVSHVQQMRESRCYKESAGRLGCTSCHDPHRVPAENEQLKFYRERCLRCHSDKSCAAPPERREEQGDSCILCHMPPRQASNVAHVTQTDHRVVRIATTRADDVREGGDVLVFFDRADLRLEDWERDRAWGLAAWKHLSKLGKQRPTQLIRILEGVLEWVPDDGIVLTAIGNMAVENRLNDLARDRFEEARNIPESEEAALSGLLDLYYLAAEKEKALKCADRLIEIDPSDARVYSLRADILATMGQKAEGIAEARHALELNPTLLPVRQWLIEALREAGQRDEQRDEEHILRRMQEARPPPE